MLSTSLHAIAEDAGCGWMGYSSSATDVVSAVVVDEDDVEGVYVAWEVAVRTTVSEVIKVDSDRWGRGWGQLTLVR